MANRQPNRLTPVNLHPRSGPSWRVTPNPRINQTPTHQPARNVRPIVLEDSDYSYSDLSSGNDNLKVVKVYNNKKSQPILLSDYSSNEEYSDHPIQTNLVRNQQTNYSDSDYYSSSTPSNKPNKKSNGIKKNEPTEINFTPQKSEQVEKTKFVRPNIRNNSTNNNNNNSNAHDTENENEQADEAVPNSSNTPNTLNQHRQRIRKRVIRSDSQQQNQDNSNAKAANDEIQKNPNESNVNKDTSTTVPNANNNNNLPNNNNLLVNSNNIPCSLPANQASNQNFDPNMPFYHFILTREFGKFKKLKTHLFTDASKVYIHSKDKKTIDRKPIHYFVGELELSESRTNSKKKFKTFSYEDSLAYLKWNKRLTRFTLCVPKPKNNRDDRVGELLGVYVETNSSYENVQHGESSTKSYLIFTAVIPKNQAPYYPVSERMDLTSLAKGDDDENRPELKKSSSEPLTKKNKKKGLNESKNEISEINISNSATNLPNEKIDQRFLRLVQADLETIPKEYLGDIFFKKSHKNFAFVDEETGIPVFIFFRSSKNSFSIKVKPPMLPLQAHALAVVVLKRNMQWQFV